MKSDLPTKVKIGCRLEGVPVLFSSDTAALSLGLVGIAAVPPLWPALAGFVVFNGATMPVLDPSGRATYKGAAPVLRLARRGQGLGFLFDGTLSSVRLVCEEPQRERPVCAFDRALSQAFRADDGDVWWMFDPLAAGRVLGYDARDFQPGGLR